MFHLIEVLTSIFTFFPLASSFVAYDCADATSAVEAYSLLEPQACSEIPAEYSSQRSVKVEIVQIQRRRSTEVVNCRVTRTTVSQYCGHSSAAGVIRWHRFRQAQTIDAATCREAREGRPLSVDGHLFPVRIGVPSTIAVPIAGGLDDSSNCQAQPLSFGGKTFTGQSGNDIFEISITRSTASIDEESGTILLDGTIRAVAGDRSAIDAAGGTYVWELPSVSCEESLSLVYDGAVDIFSNSTKSLAGSLLVLDRPETSQYAGLELQEAFVLCGYSAYRTHIPGVAVLAILGKESRVSMGKYNREVTNDFTRLETEISFLHVKTSMSLQEKLVQVREEICRNRQDIARTRLEAIAGSNNRYSLRKAFGKGHVTTRSGAVVYVSRCSPVEVTIATYPNCTEEIPVLHNGSLKFADPFSFNLRPSGSIVVCNDLAPPRWEIAGEWYCGFPEIRECHTPKSLPITDVEIDLTVDAAKGLGRSIYSPEQLQAYREFQDSIGTRDAYLADAATNAYGSRAATGEWGSGLSKHAEGGLITAVGWKYIPMFWVLGPYVGWGLTAILVLSLVNIISRICMRVWVLRKVKGPGLWIVAALWGVLYQAATAPFAWAERVSSKAAEEALALAKAPAPGLQEEDPHATSPEDEKNQLRRAYPDLDNWSA